MKISHEFLYCRHCYPILSLKYFVGWLVGWFYGISTFVSYLTPNPFLCK